MGFESGEQIVVRHDRGGFNGGRLTIEVPKLLGFRAQVLFAFDLDGGAGQAALARVRRGRLDGTAGAAPLIAFVKYLNSCRSLAEVTIRCRALMEP
jgi:hypothetical protein